MRAIYIDAFNEKIEEVDLPVNANDFNTEIRILLRTNTVNIVHSNELLTVILDGAACANPGAPAFWSNFSEEWPLFGNAICVGRNVITKDMEDLFEMYELKNFIENVKWCDKETAEKYRKIVLAYALTNFS